MFKLLFEKLPVLRPNARLLSLDAARGLAIVLVVMGHVVARDPPKGNAWVEEFKRVIYLFHMPFFMALAGITFGMTVPKFDDWTALRRYIGRRIERLLLPYLICGVAIIIGKLIASRFVHVDNIPSGSVHDIWLLLFVPAASAAGFLWFVYVLSIFFVGVASFFQIVGRYPWLLLISSIPLSTLQLPSVLMLDRCVEYLPFFSIGVMMSTLRSRWDPINPMVGLVTLIFFLLALGSSFLIGTPMWLTGTLSILAILYLVQRMPESIKQFFAKLGLSSLAIYLLNTISIGITKAGLLKLIPWDGANFLVFFPTLLAAGIILPLLARRWLPSIWRPLARYL
jgi:fucose 4-O-acetylase-like acetyltransferase